MLKHLFVILFFMTICLVLSHAQIELGGGLAFGTEIENLGIQARGRISLDENFKIVPNLTYFFTDDNELFDTNYFSIDGDVHYVFDLESVELYPLAGINIGIVRVEYDGPGSSNIDSDDSDTELGLNIGGGALYQINDQLTGFGELKFVISDFDQAVITAGVLVSLN